MTSAVERFPGEGVDRAGHLEASVRLESLHRRLGALAEDAIGAELIVRRKQIAVR